LFNFPIYLLFFFFFIISEISLLRASDKSLGNQLPFEIIEKCSSSYKDSTKEKKVFFAKEKEKKPRI
jgi:hypothetical protein